MTNVDTHILSKIVSAVHQMDPLVDVYLYGSRARGNFKDDSDWDLLILTNKNPATIKDEQLFRHHLYKIELETGHVISVFVVSNTDWKNKYSKTHLFNRITQEGIRL